MEKVLVFDTTLRDGEQSPGCSMNLSEKLQVAKQLERLKVDVIEAGFAVASKGDFEAVQEIARVVKEATVASLSRANAKDIDTAWQAVSVAARPRIHTFIASSPIHMQYKLKKSPEEVLEMAVAAVRHAKRYTADVEFSPEDATRSEEIFLYRMLEAVIAAGATVVNIPDTVGYTTPENFYRLITGIREHVSNIDKAIISVHCHDDLGMAVANSLAGVRAGARQVECTINGIGERAGNAALEEIVMALHTRKDLYQLDCGIERSEIAKSSKLIQSITGVKVQPNKAIVGANAFAHESGIHQHGVLANRETYEIMTPESIGLTANQMVLGKHSGRHAFRARLQELGYELGDAEIDLYFEKFKDLADRKKTVYDRDIDALVAGEIAALSHEYELDDFSTIRRKNQLSTTIVSVKHRENIIERIGKGDGPIDAAFDALGQIMDKEIRLEDFSIRSVTEGKDALGETFVKLAHEGRTYLGKGVSTDIIESSILAYINAVNHMSYFEERQRGQEQFA